MNGRIKAPESRWRKRTILEPMIDAQGLNHSNIGQSEFGTYR